jgi:hypothetical protein
MISLTLLPLIILSAANFSTHSNQKFNTTWMCPIRRLNDNKRGTCLIAYLIFSKRRSVINCQKIGEMLNFVLRYPNFPGKGMRTTQFGKLFPSQAINSIAIFKFSSVLTHNFSHSRILESLSTATFEIISELEVIKYLM